MLLAALDRPAADVSVLGRQPDPQASAASSLLPLMKADLVREQQFDLMAQRIGVRPSNERRRTFMAIRPADARRRIGHFAAREAACGESPVLPSAVDRKTFLAISMLARCSIHLRDLVAGGCSELHFGT
ncbi:MAG: hypothetical protein IPJ73_19975 [Zoogloea sp.]|nr:hypothetical protein [Zoogloea sp.]